MDWDRCREIDKIVCDFDWLGRARLVYDGQLPAWLSDRHPNKSRCFLHGSLHENIRRGSFNFVFKADFDDGQSWAVRFPRASVPFPDSKVVAEVATINLIQQHTDIPIPKILDWGLASANELQLGPFIISEFVSGVKLGELLTAPKQRLYREDASESLIRNVFGQIAGFMLQLSKIDFPSIGALSTSTDSRGIPSVIGPPISLKTQDLMQLSGIDCMRNRSTAFSSSLEYFEYLADVDLVQLREQLNSVDDVSDAEKKYVCWHAIKKVAPRFCLDNDRNGPFKLICDDFGPFNMLVRSEDDPTVVAVLDWEFSYAGPLELFWSPPRWLIGELPKDLKDSQGTDRYLRHLQLYIQLIEDAERDVLGDLADPTLRPSSLLRRATEGGAMWFYHVMREAFNGPNSEPYRLLQQEIPNFASFADLSSEAVQDFVELKKKHLEQYNSLEAEKEEWYEKWLDT